MSPFDFLLIAHLLGDFPLQTSWMAINKMNKWLPLLAHSIVYTSVIGIIALVGFGGLAPWQLLIIMLAHIFKYHFSLRFLNCLGKGSRPSSALYGRYGTRFDSGRSLQAIVQDIG